MDESRGKATRPCLGWGLAGTGRHAHRFIAPAIHKSASGRLVAVFSHDRERARRFAEQCDCPFAFDSLDDLLANEQIDALYVCSSNAAHKEQVVVAAQAGKHVLCEKPLADNLEDCLTMIEACRLAGVRLGVGFHLRHNPVHVRAREMIEAGAIGEPLFAEVQYMHMLKDAEDMHHAPAWRTAPAGSGGEAFLGGGMHATDLLRFLLQREIVQVYALEKANRYGSRWNHLIHICLLMERAMLVSLSAGPLRYPLNDVVVYGTTGRVRCTESVGYHGGGCLDLVSKDGVQSLRFDPSDVYVSQIDSFAESVRLGSQPSASGDDGLRVAEVAEGVYRSLETGAPIRLPTIG